MTRGLQRGKNGTPEINKFLSVLEGTPTNKKASAGTLTIAEPVTNLDTMTIGNTVYTFKTGATYAKAQGTLTIAEPVTAEDQMIIGTKTYTFKADGTATLDGHIDLGANEAATKLAIVAAINGTDSLNTANTLVSAIAFSGDDCVITAILPGTDGNAIVTTETITHASNIFDATTLGTTTAGILLTVGQIGIGADEAATKVAIVAAIMGTDLVNTTHTQVSAIAFSGDDCVITALAGGVAGDLIATTETLTHASNIFDAVTLGTTVAGVAGVPLNFKIGHKFIDATYIYTCVNENARGDNWRRTAVGSTY